MVSLSFSYDFPMVFLWCSYGFLMVFLYLSHCFPVVFLLFSCGFTMVFPWFSYGFPMVFPWFSYIFITIFHGSYLIVKTPQVMGVLNLWVGHLAKVKKSRGVPARRAEVCWFSVEITKNYVCMYIYICI